MSVLLRRVDPSLVTVVVCTTSTSVPAPLQEALERFCRHADAGALAVGQPAWTPPDPVAAEPERDGARRFVWSDGTSDRLELRTAYDAAPADVRAALHDERADELEATGEISAGLGAVAYHREHGSDPHGAGADALAWAAAHCTHMGYYHAARELGYRAAALLPWASEPEARWTVTSLLAVACTRLGLADEAGALYDDACTSSTAPEVHLHAAYGRAMLYALHHEPARRDLDRARMWVNTAIAVSSLLPRRERQAFEPTFGEDGLALLAQRLSDPEAALGVVEDGLRRLDAAPDPGDTLHRSVLEHNRAQLLVRLGQLDEALESYDRAVDIDPNYPEYHLERAGICRRLGAYDRAAADYTDAIRLSPPYAEAYYSRAELALELGDLQGALRDFGRAIELRPDLAGRDGLLPEPGPAGPAGPSGQAVPDSGDVPTLDPKKSYRACMVGLVDESEGHLDAAGAAFRTAIDADPALAAAWSGLGRVHLAQGSFDAALVAFDTALDLVDDPLVRAKRDLALREAGRPVPHRSGHPGRPEVAAVPLPVPA
jgi:tetratricopeptide (TPR) repeat protein